MALLRESAGDAEENRIRFEKQFAFQKWLFISKIKSLQGVAKADVHDECC